MYEKVVADMECAPKAAVIQDLTGFGRCALGVAIPVLSVMGCQCCAMPTAYLSAHTGFAQSEQAVFMDLSESMEGTLHHWAELKVAPAALYSGFLASAEQVKLVKMVLKELCRKETLVLVDPVMGDHGRPYRTCGKALCAGMAELAAQADVITPNLTEAAILLGESYSPEPEERTLRCWLERLSRNGRRSVVITGVRGADDQIGAAWMDRESGEKGLALTRREEGAFPGTGDLFASVLLGSLLRGQKLAEAAALAVDFVGQSVRRTLELGTPVQEGVQFEGLLWKLARLEE